MSLIIKGTRAYIDTKDDKQCFAIDFLPNYEGKISYDGDIMFISVEEKFIPGLYIDVLGRYSFFTERKIDSECTKAEVPEWFKVGNYYYVENNRIRIESMFVEENRCQILGLTGPFSIGIHQILNSIIDFKNNVFNSTR